MKWSENLIAGALARQLFNRRALVVVPKCGWTGNECDLLVVMPDLRVVDVEIKISAADWKADFRKAKWFEHWDYNIDGEPKIVHELDANGRDRSRRVYEPKRPRDWPRKVWKHYYALPEDVIPLEYTSFCNNKSGILALSKKRNGSMRIKVIRRAKPCRDAEKIGAADAVDIARLASLRMWDALEKLEAGK